MADVREESEEHRGPTRREIRNETLRLASVQYSIETQARIETLLWVLGYIDDDRCPSGAADDKRIREITNRGPWPFDPSLGGDADGD
jgi:hypothetical protein